MKKIKEGYKIKLLTHHFDVCKLYQIELLVPSTLQAVDPGHLMRKERLTNALTNSATQGEHWQVGKDSFKLH